MLCSLTCLPLSPLARTPRARLDTPEELDRLSLERALDPFQLLEKQRARISSEHWRWSHLSDEPKAWRNKGQLS